MPRPRILITLVAVALALTAHAQDATKQADKARIAKAKADLLKKQKARHKAAVLIYKGRAVSLAWVEARFKQYQHTSAFVKVELVPITKVKRYIIWGKVLQVLGDRSILLINYTRYSWQSMGPDQTGGAITCGPSLCRVTGLKITDLTDDERIKTPIMQYAGTYRYTSVLGGAKTIPTFDIMRPLSVKAFVTHLKNGGKLPKLTSTDTAWALNKEPPAPKRSMGRKPRRPSGPKKSIDPGFGFPRK